MSIRFLQGLVLFFFILSASAQEKIIKLRYEENYTPTYDEVIEMYKQLDDHYQNARLVTNGLTDSGKPLHTFIINGESVFDPGKIKAEGKSVLLINNAIHAGEPCGVDACLEFADDLLRNKDGMERILDQTVIVIVPAYSIGGLLNRSAYHRTGQTTPYETGFRGNAINYDLNRDFAKCDSENAKSFNRLFTLWDPDVFLDTHTTNGSDHRYAITLIPPQPDMFPPTQEKFLRENMLPSLYTNMKKGTYDLIPYVSWIYPDPKRGIKMTQESARYSSGYACLSNTYGMMTENHVYKPYADRVKSCYQFIDVLAHFTAEHSKEIIESRAKGIEESMARNQHTLSYQLDSTKYRLLEFKGYEVDKEQISPVTGLPRFGYDKTRPYTENIKYFNSYVPSYQVQIPEYYLVPQGYKNVVDRLSMNGVQFERLAADTTLTAHVYYIESFSNARHPYNGHYFHDTISVRSEKQEIRYYAGDLLIPVRQKKIKYLMEMLEPEGEDSFFRWNFFDNILDAREYFSNYGFEENALRYLDEHPAFKARWEEKRKNDPEFAKNHRDQLAYIYNNTEWSESSFKRYPVGRIYKADTEE